MRFTGWLEKSSRSMGRPLMGLGFGAGALLVAKRTAFDIQA
jgi:hypothetical protein